MKLPLIKCYTVFTKGGGTVVWGNNSFGLWPAPGKEEQLWYTVASKRGAGQLQPLPLEHLAPHRRIVYPPT